MNRRFFEICSSVGLLLVLLTFNPFVLPSIYLDSTRAFSFIALHKVFLLSIVNIVLLAAWIHDVFKTKILNITGSKIFVPVLLWLGVSLLSTIFSANPANSFWGAESTLDFSFVELSMLFVFFFILVNTITTTDSYKSVLRFACLGVVAAIAWTMFRFSGNWTIGNGMLKEYINSLYFVPSGHYSALVILSLVTAVLGIGLFVSDVQENKSQNTMILNLGIAVISIAGFFTYVNVIPGNAAVNSLRLYFYATLGLVACGAIFYFLNSSERLKSTMQLTAISVAIGIVAGAAMFFGIVKKDFSLPSMPLEVSWQVSLDSIKDSLQKGLIGNGPGNYVYTFDRYKSEDLVQNNFTVNGGTPIVPELRIKHSGSFLMEVLSAHGIIGTILLLALCVIPVIVALRKLHEGLDIFGFFLVVAYSAMGFSFIVTSYDFSLLLFFWILLAGLIIATQDGVPQKSLNISLTGRAFDIGQNANFILPVLLMVGCLIVVAQSLPILRGNFAISKAKEFQNLGDSAGYQRASLQAVQAYGKSDVFIRELVNATGDDLIKQLQALQQKVQQDPSAKDNPEIAKAAVQLSNYQNAIVANVNTAMSMQPDEYRNFYLAGLLVSRVSELSGYSADASAENYFVTALNRNPYHPDTLFQLAKIYERNKQYNAAFTDIRLANKYEPNNLYYQLKLADILVDGQSYKDALNIYQAFKKLKDENPDNEQVQKLYESQQIEKKITELSQLPESSGTTPTGNQPANETSPSPSAKVTPTVGAKTILPTATPTKR